MSILHSDCFACSLLCFAFLLIFFLSRFFRFVFIFSNFRSSLMIHISAIIRKLMHRYIIQKEEKRILTWKMACLIKVWIWLDVDDVGGSCRKQTIHSYPIECCLMCNSFWCSHRSSFALQCTKYCMCHGAQKLNYSTIEIPMYYIKSIDDAPEQIKMAEKWFKNEIYFQSSHAQRNLR